MNECITETTCHFTPAVSLAALGVVLEQRKVFEPIRAHVQIEEKTVKHTPLDKLYDSFITVLAGAHGLVEINTLLRADPALQRAFGRKQCAEQSVVQQTLDACTPVQVAQMEQAMDEIYRTHRDRKSTRLNSSHTVISYAVFCLKKKKKDVTRHCRRADMIHRELMYYYTLHGGA